MSSELKDTLKKRLDENYTAFIASLQEKTVSELIAMAPEITAAQQLHEELLNACDEDDAAFLAWLFSKAMPPSVWRAVSSFWPV